MWEKIKALFSKVGQAVLSFVSPLAQSIEANGGPVLIAAAEQEVAAAEAAAVTAIAGGGTVTGEAKFVQAQTAVIQTLTSQGIPVVVNAVNGAIESAVASMNANNAANALMQTSAATANSSAGASVAT